MKGYGLRQRISGSVAEPLIAREIIVGVTATLLFFLSVVMIPVVGIVVGTFTPLPTLLAYYRWGSPLALLGPGRSGASRLCAACLPQCGRRACPTCWRCCCSVSCLGWECAGAGRWSGPQALPAGSSLPLALLVFWVSYGGGAEGSGMLIERDLRDAVGMLLQQYGASSADKQLVEETLQKMLPFLLKLLPGAALSSTLMACWLNLLVAKRYCRVRQLPLARLAGMVAVESTGFFGLDRHRQWYFAPVALWFP